MKIYRLQPQKQQNMQKLRTALYHGAVLLLNDFTNQLYIFIIHFLWDAARLEQTPATLEDSNASHI